MRLSQSDRMRRSRVFAISAYWIVLTTVSWAAFQNSNSAQPEAQKLANALADLQRTPEDPTVQQTYLDAFPHDYKSFLQLFDYGGVLSDGHAYIQRLRTLSKTHELEVGRLLVQLSKDAHYEADAPSYLQHVTAAYGSEHPATFAALLKKLSPEDRGKLITFLADVEVHSSYLDYQNIVKELRARHEIELARQFELARQKRQRKGYRH